MSVKRTRSLAIIAIFTLIDCIGAIPCSLSLYGWCAYSFLIGQLTFAFGHWQHTRQYTPSRPLVYEVGSLASNAQSVSAIHALNERLATEGKHIPEKIARNIVQ